MSLMEFIEIRDGAFVPSYREILLPFQCEWCKGVAESVSLTGDNWICPDCIGELRGGVR